MTSDWVIPSVDDVQKFMASAVVGASNELDSGGVNVLDGPNGILAKVVAEMRGACSNRQPVSLQSNAIPPEGFRHAMMLCVEHLINRMPQMSQYANSETLGWSIKASRDWLSKAYTEGTNFSRPRDADPAAEPTGPVFGSFVDAFVDLTLDGPPTA